MPPRILIPHPSPRSVAHCPTRIPARPISVLAHRHTDPVPFFTPPFRPGPSNLQRNGTDPERRNGKGKAKAPDPGADPEQEVDDHEWEMRVARAMLHLRDTLPHFFHPEQSSSKMLPSDVFSQHVVLKLPAPFPIKVSSLAAYSMAFSIARNGMSALHTDLHASLERMTFSPQPNLPDNRADMLLSRKSVPQHRRKQIRVLVSVSGIPRLPPHKEATWQTSSLYTFSPYSGLIISHEVETIRPLPGEGVAEWVMSRLLGWTTRHAAGEGAMPVPRAMAVEPEPEVVRFKRQKGRGINERGETEWHRRDHLAASRERGSLYRSQVFDH